MSDRLRPPSDLEIGACGSSFSSPCGSIIALEVVTDTGDPEKALELIGCVMNNCELAKKRDDRQCMNLALRAITRYNAMKNLEVGNSVESK